MTKPSDYKYVRAWERMMGAYEYYILGQEEKAYRMKAPLDALYEREGAWRRYSELPKDVKAKLQRYLPKED